MVALLKKQLNRLPLGHNYIMPSIYQRNKLDEPVVSALTEQGIRGEPV